MSEQVSRLAVNYLRNHMVPALPPDVQNLIPLVTDPLVAGQNQVPNVVVGQYLDFGANPITPMITVHCEGPAEGIVNVYRHLDLHIDIWIGGNVATNVDGRRLTSIISEYCFRSLNNTNWSGISQSGGSYVQIQRSYETNVGPILFEPQNKIYHKSITLRVEALSKTWY